MASGSHETPLQLRIIPCHVGLKSFGVHLELEDLGFHLELEDLGFHLELEDLGFHLELEDLGFQSELEVFFKLLELSCGTWWSYLVQGIVCACPETHS